MKFPEVISLPSGVKPRGLRDSEIEQLLMGAFPATENLSSVSSKIDYTT
jgi:hypothetical protein